MLSSCQKGNEEMTNTNISTIRLATFNTGSFVKEFAPSAQPDGVSLFRDVVKETQADILFTQEDLPFWTEGISPYEEFFNNYPYYAHEGTTTLNYYGVYSNYPIVSSKSVQFENKVTHTHFMVAEIDIQGVVIAFANIHLDWCDNTTRTKQLCEVRNYMAQYNIRVVIGDFNPDNYVNYTKNFNEQTYEDYSTWKEDFKIFTDAGYEYVNASILGYHHTFFAIPELTENNITYPLDNIMYKSDLLSLQTFNVVYHDYLWDHIPLYADFYINVKLQ